MNIASKFRMILLIIVAFITPFVNFAYGFVRKYVNISFVENLMSKAYYYLNDTSSEWGLAVQASSFMTVERIIYVSFAVFVSAYYILNSYPISKTIRPIEQSKETAMFQNFAFVAGGLFTLACASMLTPGYWRFYSALVIFGGVFFIPYTESNLYKKISVFIKIYLLAVGFAGLAMGVYQIRTGIKDIISSMLITSPLFVFVKDLLNLM